MDQADQNIVPVSKSNLPNRGVLLLAIAVIVLIVVFSWSEVLDRGSSEYVDQALTRSALAYAAARGLNGVISVVQSTTFSFSVMGGVSVAAGEILDPINDLVEQYSTLMKFSIGSLLIQAVLLEIVSHEFFKIATTISGAVLIGSLLVRANPLLAVATRAFIFIVFLRFILLLVILLNSVVSHVFIEEKTRADIQHLTALSSEVNEAIEISEEDQQTRNNASAIVSGLRERRAELMSERQSLEEPLRLATQRLSEAEQVLSSARSAVGIIDRLMGDNPQIQAALQERNTARDEQASIQAQYVSLTKQLADNQQEIQKNENISAGLPSTMTERARAQLNGFVSAIDPRLLKARIEGSITNIIRVMSLFVFETTILPLIFLYLLSKGMSAIWGVDLRKLIGVSRDSGREKTTQPLAQA